MLNSPDIGKFPIIFRKEDCNWQKFSSKKKAIGFLEKVDHGLEQVRLLKFEAAAREQEARSVKRQIEKEFFNHD